MTLGTNFLLAILWAAIVGPFTPGNLAVGFVIGYVVLRVSVGGERQPAYIRHVLSAASLAAFTVMELVIANGRVAWYTMSTLNSLRPAVLRVPLEPGSTDAEVSLLSMLITLTPGTLTLDVEEGHEALLVHFMHVEDAEEAVASIKRGFERRVLEVTR